MKKKLNNAFTLVELIVVITILAIIWTISFISFNSYTKNARDSVRITDIKNLSDTLELFISEKWFYPMPSSPITITWYSWAIAWIQWTAWDTLIQNLWTLSKKPVDPVFNNEYAYSINSLKNEFQIWWIVEWEKLAFNNSLINNTYANLEQPFALIKWSYNWKILITSTWLVDYVYSIPSIIANNLSSTDLNTIVSNKRIIYDNLLWAPATYSKNVDTSKNNFSFLSTWSNLLVFSWSLTKDLYWEWLFSMINNLHTAYSWSVINPYSIDIWKDQSDLAVYTWEIIKKVYWLPTLTTTKSCEEILLNWKSTWDWFYHFFSSDNSKIYETYCDMTNWWRTFLFSTNPSWNRWKYDSIQWTKPTIDSNLSSNNVFTTELTSWAYWWLKWNEVKICRWSLSNCYIFKHNQSRTLQSFFNIWDSFSDYTRCYPNATYCDSWELPDDVWDDNHRASFLSLVWDWNNYISWRPRQWLWINLSIKNRLWIQLDHNNVWPDYDNMWYWIWIFRSRNCWYDAINWLIDNTRARSAEWLSWCWYITPDPQVWFVFSK